MPARVSCISCTISKRQLWHNLDISLIRQPNDQDEQVHLANAGKNQSGSSSGPAFCCAKTKQCPRQYPQSEPGGMDLRPVFSA